MTVEAELADGRVLEFPDGTDPSVVQATVKKMLGIQDPQTSLGKTIGTGLLGGAAQGVAGAGAFLADYGGKALSAAGATDTGQTLQDVASSLDASRDYWRQKQADNGGNTFAGKVAGLAGGIAPALLFPEAEIPAMLATAVTYAGPAFRDTYNEKIKEGDSQPLAFAHAIEDAGINMFMPKVATKGVGAIGKALGSKGEGVISQLAQSAGEGAAFDVGSSALHKATDEAAGVDNPNQPWINPESAAVSAATFPLIRGAHMLAGAPAATQAAKEQQQTADGQARADTAMQAQMDAAQQKQAATIDAANAEPTATATAGPSGEAAGNNSVLQRQLEQSQQAYQDAVAKAGAAARSGDMDGAKAAQDEAQQHAQVISTLTPLIEKAAPPPPPPAEPPPLIQQQKRLANLLGDDTKPGLYQKALMRAQTDPREFDIANQYHQEATLLQAQIKARQDNLAELSNRQTDLTQQKVGAPPRNPMADWQQANDQLDQDRTVSDSIRQENATGQEIAGMEANRLPMTGLPTQLNLLGQPPRTVVNRAEKPTVGTELDAIQRFQAAKATGDKAGMQNAVDDIRSIRAQGNTNPEKPQAVAASRVEPINIAPTVDTTPVPRETTPEMVKDQIAKLPQNLTPEQDATVGKIQDNLGAIAVDPQRLSDVGDWLHRIGLGDQVLPTGMAGERGTDFRQRDINQMLASLETGKRDTQNQNDLFPHATVPMDARGRVIERQPEVGPPAQTTETPTVRTFNTPEEFNQFLGSNGLALARQHMGILTQTMSRALRNVEPIQRRIDALTQNLKAVQAKHGVAEKNWDSWLNETDRAHMAAKIRLQDVTDKLMQERGPLERDYLKAQLELKNSTDFSRSMTRMLLENKAHFGEYRETMADTLQRKLAAEEQLGKLLAEPVSKDNWDTMRGLQKNIQALSKEFERYRGGLPDTLNKYLAKDRDFQARLSEELAHMGELHSNYMKAKTDLYDLAAKQGKRIGPKNAAAAVELTRQGREEAARAVAQGREQNQTDVQRLEAERRSSQAKAASILEPVQRAQAERIKKAASAEATQGEGERKSNAERQAEQTRLERGETEMTTPEGTKVPTERVSFERQREIRDYLADAPEKLKDLRAQLEQAKTAVGITSGKARGEAQNARKAIEVQISKLNGRVKQYEAVRNAASPEGLETLQKRIAKQAQRVDVLKTKIADEGKTRSNKSELTKAENLLQKLDAAHSKKLGVEKTTLPTKLEQETAAYGRRNVDTAYEPRTPQEAKLLETGRLPARTIGPVVKKVVAAGDTRTGTPESKEGDNKVGTRNPPTQAGEKRPITAKQAMRAGNEAAKPENLGAKEALRASNEADAKAEEAQRQREEAEADEENNRELAEHEKKFGTGELDNLGEEYLDSEYYPQDYPKAGHDDNTTLLDHETSKHVIGGDTDAALESLSRNGSTPEVRALAEKLRPLLTDTKLSTNKNLTHEGQKVAGVYHEATNNIEMHPLHLSEEDLQHEMVHAATVRVMNMSDAQRTPEQNKALKELQGMYDVAKRRADFKDEYANTNLKEFVAEVYSNRLLREKLDNIGAPRSLLARIWDKVKTLLGLNNSTKAMGAIDKLMADSGSSGTQTLPKVVKNPAFDFGRDTYERRGKLERVLTSENKKSAGLQLEQWGADMRASMMKALSYGNKDSGLVAQRSLRQADDVTSAAMTALEKGAFGFEQDRAGHTMMTAGHGPAFPELMHAIKEMGFKNGEDNINAFAGGVLAKHAEQVGWDKLDFGNTAEAQRKGEAQLAAINADPKMKAAFEKANDIYQKMNRAQVDFVAKAHALPQDVIDAMRTYKNYTPMYRVDGDTVNMILPDGHPRSIGDIRSQPWLAMLEGGDQKLMPFEQAVLRNTTILTNLGMRNFASRSIAYHLQDLGKTAGVMQVRIGKGPDKPEVMRFMQKPDPNRAQDNGWRHIVLDTKGTAAEGIPTPLLAQAAAGSFATIPKMLKAAQWVNGFLRSGVTRFPAYLLSQTTKDAVNASMYGNVKVNPITSAFRSLGSLYGTMAEKSPAAQALAKHGVKHSQIMGGNSDDFAKVAMQMTKDGGLSWYRKAMASADTAAMSAEGATRAQIYNDVIKSGGSELEAIHKASDSMNYNLKGSSAAIQIMGQLIPFFHTSITGINNTYHALKGDAPSADRLNSKQMMMNRALGLGAMAIAYSTLMEDDPKWSKMSLRDKMAYIHIPGYMTPSGETLRLSTPFEMGTLFYSLPIAFAEGLKQKFSPEDWKQVREVLGSGLLPSGGQYMPHFALGAYDVSRNYNSSTGLPIEPKGMEHLDPSQRFTARTTELAKRMSEEMTAAGVKLSPVQLEYLANSYFGQFPHAVATMVNQVFDDKRPGVERAAGNLADNPWISRFVQSQKRPDDTNHMYEAADNADTAKATFDHLIKSGDTAKALSYMKEHRTEYMSENMTNSFKQQMKKLTDAENVISNAANIPAAAKQQRLDNLDRIKETLAGNYRKALSRLETSQAQ